MYVCCAGERLWPESGHAPPRSSVQTKNAGAVQGSYRGTHLRSVTGLASACDGAMLHGAAEGWDGSTSLSVPASKRSVRPSPPHPPVPTHPHSIRSHTHTPTHPRIHTSSKPCRRRELNASTTTRRYTRMSRPSANGPLHLHARNPMCWPPTAYAIKAPSVSSSRLKAFSAPGFVASTPCVVKGLIVLTSTTPRSPTRWL